MDPICWFYIDPVPWLLPGLTFLQGHIWFHSQPLWSLFISPFCKCLPAWCHNRRVDKTQGGHTLWLILHPWAGTQWRCLATQLQFLDSSLLQREALCSPLLLMLSQPPFSTLLITMFYISLENRSSIHKRTPHPLTSVQLSGMRCLGS
jgi:hypothetical protein